jgi:hypothetical protein
VSYDADVFDQSVAYNPNGAFEYGISAKYDSDSGSMKDPTLRAKTYDDNGKWVLIVLHGDASVDTLQKAARGLTITGQARKIAFRERLDKLLGKGTFDLTYDANAFDEEEGRTVTCQYYLLRQGKGYVISATSQKEQFGKHESELDKVLRTFRLE